MTDRNTSQQDVWGTARRQRADRIRPRGGPFQRWYVRAVITLLILGSNTSGWSQITSPSQGTSPPLIDLTPKTLPVLQAGIVVGEQAAFGYSDLLTLVLPRLASGDIESLPDYSKDFARMFQMTILANVVQLGVGDQQVFALEKIGIGFAMNIEGKTTIVTSATANDLGANLGIIGRRILSGNETCLDDVVQVARTDRLVIFDAQNNMLIGDKHESRILRYFVWVSPASGKLGILVWQLNDDGNGQYTVDSDKMQLLPGGMKEDRRIHVSSAGFLRSRIPKPDRFALEQIPQGTPVPFSPRMRGVAGLKQITSQNLETLLAGAAESIIMMQSTKTAVKPTTVRKPAVPISP